MEINKFLRLFEEFIPTPIYCVKRKQTNQLKDLLLESYVYETLEICNNDSSVVKIKLLDKDLFVSVLANEAFRFLSASLISFQSSFENKTSTKNLTATTVTPWRIIQNYYAAYYGIHFLNRIAGRTLTRLDFRHRSNINNNHLKTVNNVFANESIGKTGNCSIKFDFDNDQMVLDFNKSDKGGSHQDIWDLWRDLLVDLQMKASQDIFEYANLSSNIDFHLRFIRPNRPSSIRNEINYQFDHGVWPFARQKQIMKLIDNSFQKYPGKQQLNKCDVCSLLENNYIIFNIVKEMQLLLMKKGQKTIWSQNYCKFNNN
jgi:hypothetical protein